MRVISPNKKSIFKYIILVSILLYAYQIFFELNYILLFTKLLVLFVITALIYQTYFEYFAIGAPIVNTNKNVFKEINKALKEHKRTNFLDLGSGLGDVCMSIKSKKIEITGYEINIIAYLISKFRCRNKKNIKIFKKNYWNEDLKEFDTIFVYGISYMMQKLEDKLSKELKKDAIVICYFYKLPTKKPIYTSDKLFVYKF